MPDYVENVILAMGRRFRLPICVSGGRGFCHISCVRGTGVLSHFSAI